MARARSEAERLVALALKRGMVSRDALRECQRLRAASESKGGRPKSLLHLLVAES